MLFYSILILSLITDSNNSATNRTLVSQRYKTFLLSHSSSTAITKIQGVSKTIRQIYNTSFAQTNVLLLILLTVTQKMKNKPLIYIKLQFHLHSKP